MARIRVGQVSSMGPSRQAESRKPVIRVKQLSVEEYIESKVGGELIEKLMAEYNRIVKYDSPVLSFKRAVKEVFSLRTKFYDTRLEDIIFSLHNNEVKLCDLNDISLEEFWKINEVLYEYKLLIAGTTRAMREGQMPKRSKQGYMDLHGLLEDMVSSYPNKRRWLSDYVKYAGHSYITNL